MVKKEKSYRDDVLDWWRSDVLDEGVLIMKKGRGLYHVCFEFGKKIDQLTCELATSYRQARKIARKEVERLKQMERKILGS